MYRNVKVDCKFLSYMYIRVLTWSSVVYMYIRTVHVNCMCLVTDWVIRSFHVDSACWAAMKLECDRVVYSYRCRINADISSVRRNEPVYTCTCTRCTFVSYLSSTGPQTSIHMYM